VASHSEIAVVLPDAAMEREAIYGELSVSVRDSMRR
jgi:hypothetical protein